MRANRSSQLFCAWAGPASMVVFGIALWPLMGFLPPLSPALPAQELADIYRTNATRIILGATLLPLAGGLTVLYSAPIAVQMKRMEGSHMPLTYGMMMQTVMVNVPFLLAAGCFIGAAYRPERSTETIQTLSDLGFLFLIIPAFFGFFQVLLTGFAILRQEAEIIIPRWVGYLNLWAGALVLPAAVIGLFKTGPFAWNGLLAFWLGACSLGIWLTVMTWYLIVAINKQAAITSPVAVTSPKAVTSPAI